MGIKKQSALAILLLLAMTSNNITNGIQIKLQEEYKCDDMDDLLEGVITNKLTGKPKDQKQLGQTDLLVQQAYNDAMKDVKQDTVKEKVQKSVKPLSQEE